MERRTDEQSGKRGDNMADLIDRQVIIDAVRKCSVKEITPAFILVDKAEVMTELMMLPSAQPDQKWIPCSERLPDKEGLYIVTNLNDKFSPVSSRYFNKRGDSSFWSGHPLSEVTAWMPLPEPYREEGGE